MAKPLELIGKRFGRLVVIDRAEDKINEKTGKHKTQWLCKCDCGSEPKIILGSSLTSGSTKSCGCLHKETASHNAKTKISHGKKYNTYDLSGDYGIGWTTNTNEEFYFNLKDYDKIKDICWYANNRGYIVGHDCKNKGENIKIHQLILPTKKGYVIDYISGNKKDNRKSNLREATQQNNCMNKAKQKNNKSGITGVCLDTRSGKWVAYIGYNKKHITIGYFKKFEDAIKAHKEAEEKYFGEFQYKGECYEENY